MSNRATAADSSFVVFGRRCRLEPFLLVGQGCGIDNFHVSTKSWELHSEVSKPSPDPSRLLASKGG
jgi:hypothetical protein